MRIPADVLDRVRGAVVVATLATTACGADPTAPPPSAPPTIAPVVEAPPPEPLDPVAYASADEAARLDRLDAEEAVALATRTARVDHLTEVRREEREQRQRIAVQPPLWSHVCYACGRG